MDEAFTAALAAALKRLRSRERFEAELRAYLVAKGFEEATVDAVLAHLKVKGMLSDGRAIDAVLAKRSGNVAVF